MAHQSATRKFLANIAGYGIGQGSMLVSQTYTASSGQLDLVGFAGAQIALITLFVWISDFSGLTTLQRLPSDRDGVRAAAQALFAGRLLIAVVGLGTFFVAWLLIYHTVNPILSMAVFIATSATVFNVQGYIETTEKAIWCGLINTVPWVASAASLFLAAKGLCNENIPALAFSLGTATAVCWQNTVDRQSLTRVALDFDRWTAAHSDQFKSGWKVTAGAAAGQVFGRGIPLLLQLFGLSERVVGMYVYARGIANGVGQAVILSRRASFHSLVNASNDTSLNSRSTSTRTILITQAPGVALAASTYVVATAVSHMGLAPDQFNDVLPFLCWLLLTLTGWSIAHSFGQLLLARGAAHAYMLTNLVGVSIGVAVIALLAPRIGLMSVIWAETVVNVTLLTGGAVTLSYWRRK